jgi:membrane protein required for colicin V production
MTGLDQAALVLVGLFSVWGIFTGFSRQVASSVAAIAAFAAAAPGGRVLARPVAEKLGVTLTVGTVAATLLVLVVVWLLVRWALAAALRRLLAGDDGERRGLDRALGGLLGGGKTAAVIFMGVSAAVFLEGHLVMAGRRLSLTPKDSVLVRWAREVNVIERLQFPGVRDLTKVLQTAGSPEAAARLKGDPDYAALLSDPRFRGLAAQGSLQRAIETGDASRLLQANGVLELLKDPQAAGRLERLGAKLAAGAPSRDGPRRPLDPRGDSR